MNYLPNITKIKDNGLRILSLTILFVFWYVLAASNIIDETLIAHPKEVLKVLVNSFMPDAPKSEHVHLHALSTIWLAFKGWGISMLIGIFIGGLIGQSKLALNLIEPIVDFFRSIPPVLAFPLLLVAFNYGIPAYTWTIVFGCLPTVIITVSNGVHQIVSLPFDILRYVHANKVHRQLFYAVEMLPSIVLSARLSFSFSIIIAIVCEMVFTPRSGWALGALARDSEINFDTPLFYTCVIIIGIYGYLVNRLLIKIEQSL